MNYIRLLQLQISVTEDLKHLFILLIRNYNPSMQSRQYLQDLIVTNHILLLIPDGISQTPDPESHHKLMEHIKQYGRLHSISIEFCKLEFRQFSFFFFFWQIRNDRNHATIRFIARKFHGEWRVRERLHFHYDAPYRW